PAADGSEDLAIPPGDPWYEPAPQQRGGRPNGADRLVLKMRITPHWFDSNDRFWYRNDLAGGAKEFILVDARRGTRQPAFDHAKLGAALSTASGKTYSADRLPFEDIDFAEGGKAVRFRVADATWECDLDGYHCARIKDGDKASPSPAMASIASRRERAF